MTRSGLVSPVLISLPGVILLALLALSAAPTVHGFGLDCEANSTGAWDVADTWTGCNDTTPGEGDHVSITGYDAQVTISAGLNVAVQSISVSDYGRLINKGSLTVGHLEVYQGALHSTGALKVEDSNGNGAYLRCAYGTIELAHDLTITGSSEAYLALTYSQASFGGSINVTAGEYNEAYVAVLSDSRASVAGDVTVLSGSSYDSKRRETDEPMVETKKRGFSLDGSGMAVDYDSFLQVGGDVKLTTRNNTDNSSTASLRDVSLFFDGGDVVIGGDLVVQSGDSNLASTGAASISTGESIFYLLEGGGDPSSYATGSLVVGGSVTVQSGSVKGLRSDSGQSGNPAGDTYINLVKGFLLANGSHSTITVKSGNSGSSLYYGRDGSAVNVLMGFGSQLAVTKDLVLQAGLGGDAGEGQRSGRGGESLLGVANGGDLLVGGNLYVVAGDGGNNAMNTTSYAGDGGEAQVMMANGGSINVAGDLLVAPGSAGQAAVGGNANAGAIYLGTVMNNGGGPCTVKRGCLQPIPIGNKRGSSSFVSSGAMNMRVGGDVTVRAGSPSSSISGGYSGGACYSSLHFQDSNVYHPPSGGLAVENVWEGEVIIGGDLNVIGCNGGSSIGSSGGNAIASMVSVSGGVTLDVYGSVVIEGGNGGSVLGGSSTAGGAGSARFEIYGSLANIGGSVTLTGGAGGDVVNGTGNGGSVFMDTELALSSRAHLVVGEGKGAITIVGGRGGNVNAENTPGSTGNGGSPSEVHLSIHDSSSVTAGDVRLVGSSAGNATVSGSGPVPDAVTILREAADSSRRHASQSAPHHKTDTEQKKRGKGFLNNPRLEVGSRSSIIVNKDLQLLPGTPFFHNVNSLQFVPASSIIASELSTVTINGDLTVRGVAGARVSSTNPYTLLGGSALVELQDGAVLKARGDVVLQGGDAGHDFANASITGFQGVVGFTLNSNSQFHQSGLVRLIDGQGETLPAGFSPYMGIAVVASEWTVYPCAGAGLEVSDSRNGTNFQVRQLSTFRDCRGSGAKQHYPEPQTDASADASCSPCTCTEAPFNACPVEEAAAGSVHDNNFVVACLRALSATFSTLL